MKVKNAAKHYKSKAEIARRLGLERSTVTKWGDIVPLKYAWELYYQSHGRVPVGLADYRMKAVK